MKKEDYAFDSMYGKFKLVALRIEKERRERKPVKVYAREVMERVEEGLPLRRSVDELFVRKHKDPQLMGKPGSKIMNRNTVNRQLRGAYDRKKDQR